MKVYEPGGSLLISNKQISSPMPVAWDPTSGKWLKFDLVLQNGVPVWKPVEADPPQTYTMTDGTEWAPHIKYVNGVPVWGYQQLT